MNILFLTMNRFTGIDMHNIYSDLMTELINRGHHPYIATPREKSIGEQTELRDNGSYHLLTVRTGNISNVSFIEKGISTVLMEFNFLSAIKKYLRNVKFDMVLYSTPPVTFSRVIKYVKKRDNAFCYLMLKDIFPQNAVDLGMFSSKSLIYKYFRKKEADLYCVSDKIGCMSKANEDFVLKHNPGISAEKVGLCENSVFPLVVTENRTEKKAVREKYGIPDDKTVFVYGGNLGRPQGVDHIISCMKAVRETEKAFFLIVGGGSEQSKLQEYADSAQQTNLMVLKGLERMEYERLAASCDVGLIFLDHRFTIPNFPSRLLSYMQAGLPTLACTDPNTDVGDVISQNNFGWKCESNNATFFAEKVAEACNSDLKLYGENAYKYLTENFTVEKSCQAILDACNGEKSEG